MTEQQIKVSNSLGIHARPASIIVKTAMKFNSSISIIKDGATADAKSIMSVMMLAAGFETVVTIRTDGDDESDALEAIVELFNNKFNEE